MPRRLFPLLILTLAAAAFIRLWELARIPPGLHYDLATNLLLADDILYRGYRPIFVEAFTGREALFFYWLAGLVRLLGSRILTLHLAGAFVGLLTVPATYFCVRQVLAHERHSRWIAAGAALLLAANLWHVLLSRLGYRLITEPLIQALALGFLYRGLRTTSNFKPPPSTLHPPLPRPHLWSLNFVLAGLFTGLAAYTYLAARAFPIPLAVALLFLILARPPNPQLLITRLLVFALVAIVVFAPLGWFFYTHPAAFFNRIGQVAPQAGDAALLRQSAVAALEMLFIRGDPYERFNLPGLPIFGPILGVFFLIGLAVTTVRLFHPITPSPLHSMVRSSELLLLVWLPAMLLPTVLAVHEIFPSNVRAIGLIPLVFVFPARGLVASVEWLAHRLRTSRQTQTPTQTLTVTLALATLSTALTYFYTWGQRPSVYYANDGDIAAAAQWLNTQDTAGASVYLSAIHYRHPTAAVLARDYAAVRWYTGGQAIAVPDGGPALYVFPRSAPPPAEWLAGWEAFLAAAPAGPDGTPDFHAYRFDTPPPLPDFEPAWANFGNLVELSGYRVAAPGVVDFRLRVLNPPPVGDYRIVADLVDAAAYHWAQGFNDAYPSEQWQIGETIISRVKIALPAGAPPGDYSLAVTIYAPSTKENLPALDAAGQFAGTAATVGPVTLPRAPLPAVPPTPQTALNAQMGPLTLLGYDFPSAALRPGEPLTLALYWQADEAPGADYRPALALIAPDGGLVPLVSGHPAYGTYPTSVWSSGEVVIDRYQPRLPRDLAAGIYGLHLDLLDSSSTPVASADLGQLAVAALARDFGPAAPAHPLNANLGNAVTLLGYAWETLQTPTPTQTLTLYWQAQAEMDADYTVFVHVLDANGQIVAQRDVQPRDGAYPTSLWLRGEVVTDTHPFALPAGNYTIEVGLYLPQNGERLGALTLGGFVVP